MAQHDYNIANQGFPQLRTDLNQVLSAIVTSNSGPAAPTTTYANMWWYDTTNNLMRVRNSANTGWITIGFLDPVNNIFIPYVRALRAIDANGLSFQTDEGTVRLLIDDNGGVGIGGSAAASAILDLNSTTRGFRGPRMTTTQRLAIAAPASALLVYDTDLSAYYVYNGTAWIPVGAGGGLFKGNGGEVGLNPGDIFRINAKTLTSNVTIDADENAQATGPLAVNTGVTLTVTTGGNLVIT